MIIWSGYGVLVGAIGFACLLAVDAATRIIFGDNQYYQAHGWPKLLAFWIAAAIVWPIGRSVNHVDERELVDPKTGERVLFRKGGGHSLFFIPVEYWTYVFVALGIAFFFVT